MYQDALLPFYTESEAKQLELLRLRLEQEYNEAAAALMQYAEAHSEDGKTATVRGAFLNETFSKYNATVEEITTAKAPAIVRYAEKAGSTAAIVEDGKRILRGIRMPDVEAQTFYTPFLHFGSDEGRLYEALLTMVYPQMEAIGFYIKTAEKDSPAYNAAVEDARRLAKQGAAKAHRIMRKRDQEGAGK